MDATDNRSLDICLYVFCVAGLYNAERKHQSLKATPDQAYWGKIMLPEAA
jgi:hypothetical protein